MQFVRLQDVLTNLLPLVQAEVKLRVPLGSLDVVPRRHFVILHEHLRLLQRVPAHRLYQLQRLVLRVFVRLLGPPHHASTGEEAQHIAASLQPVQDHALPRARRAALQQAHL